jgi:hypothetical protein
MKCQNIQEKFPDLLTGELDQSQKDSIEAHLAECDTCREELRGLSAIWTKLGVIPEEKPSNGLRLRFYSMLEDYKQELKAQKSESSLSKRFNHWLERWWPKRQSIQFASAMLLLCVGLITGLSLGTDGEKTTEMAQLRSEVYSMRQMLATSLLEQSSPSARLKGVSLSYQMENPNQKMLDKLLHTLNNDPNINVRLSAVDALYLFYNNPTVRKGLIQSISHQSSPLVQVALIDLIVSMKERQAVDSLKQLIQDEQLNPDVKHHAQLGIQQLTY